MSSEHTNEEAVKEAIDEAKKAAGAQAEEEKADEAKVDEARAGEAEPNEAKAEGDAADDAQAEDAASSSEPGCENTNGDEPEGKEQDSKEGFFGKKKDKKKKKDPKDEQIEDLTDKLKRQMAEFDNFRKRTEKEKSRMYEIGAGDVIGKILPVLDNFERGLSAVTEEQKEDPLAEGMEKIYKQFTAVLEEIGVKPIEAAGTEFNPDFHNAVMHVEDENAGENIVVEEFQKGYMYRDTVIRHSMVKVAN